MDALRPNPSQSADHADLQRRRLVGGAAAALAAPFVLPSRARAQSNDLRIGWIRPTTGRLASSFAPLYTGGLIAIDEINAAGGILGRKVVIEEEDDEASPAKEPAVVKKLKSNNIDIVVGPTGSSQVLASLAATTQAKMIQCGISNGTEMGDGARYPYHYLCVFTTDQEGELAASYMTEQLKIGKVGILHESTPFGETAAAASRRKLKELTGKDPVSVQTYAMTATDLAPQIANLQKAGAEGVIVWMASNVHIGMAFNTMARLNWLPPVIGHVNLFNDALFDLVPVESLKSVYGIYYRPWTYSEKETALSARHQALSAKLKQVPAAKGIEAYIAGTPHYDFLYLLKQVAEEQKSLDVERLRQGFNNVRGFKGLLGSLSFTETQHAGIPMGDLTLASVASGRDPRSVGASRLRAPGA